MKLISAIVFCLIISISHAQDVHYLKVHFLYGSKPSKEYKDTEQKWFGGVLGGHVGIEGDDGKILNFLPQGDFHAFAKSNNRHSTYAEHSFDDFYGILGGNPDSVKKAIVVIPVTTAQMQKFDSIANAYLKQTPYDYALIGMRCGSAAYDVLEQVGILPTLSDKVIYKKIFYPKKLRERLFEQAAAYQWTILRQEGSGRRIWEQD